MEQFGLFAIAALVVGASKGGLASAAALAVPALAIWMDPLVAAGVLLPIFIASDAVGVWLYRHEYSARNLAVMIPAGLAGVVLATLLAPVISTSLATCLTGLIGLAYCLQSGYRRLRRDVTPPVAFHLWKGVFWGILTGMTSFVSHSGAPPFQAFVLPQKLDRMSLAGTNTITFAAINLFKLPAYASVGLLTDIQPVRFLALAIIAAFGAVLGRWIAQAMSDRIYVATIEAILFFLSVYLVMAPPPGLFGQGR